MTSRVALGMLVACILPVTASAEPRRDARAREFVPKHELGKAFPKAVFEGDVRVQRGAVIDPDVVLKQTGSKPLYVLSGTQLGGSQITQSGDRPLILSGSEIVGSTVTGSGVLRRSVLVQTYAQPNRARIGSSFFELAAIEGPVSIFKSSVRGGVVRGLAQAREAEVYGILTGHDDRPIRLEGKRLEPLFAVAPDGWKVSFEPPPKGQDGPGVLRVLDPKGRGVGGQVIDVYWNAAAGKHTLDLEKGLRYRVVVSGPIESQ